MKMLKNTLLALIGGILLSLLSGVMVTTPQDLVGAQWYGWPLAWRFRMIVAPEYNPWHFEWLNLLADIVFWVVVIFVVVLIVEKLRKKKPPSEKKP